MPGKGKNDSRSPGDDPARPVQGAAEKGRSETKRVSKEWQMKPEKLAGPVV